MPYIDAIATTVPPYAVSQSDSRTFASKIFAGRLDGLERLLPVFKNSGIETRYFSKPIDWFGQPHTLSEKNLAYVESSTDLVCGAAASVLASAGLSPSDIDYIIYINTTGLATPSIDARLINRLGLRSNVRRTPIWGLGCAGGAAGISHAFHHLLGHPDQRVLLVACELCGLTFIPDDYSKSNFVASALFGEGAAAVLIVGDEVGGEGPEIVATNSRFYPDSLDVMGWNVVDSGLQVVFAQRIPDIVSEHIARDFAAFLESEGLTLDDIDSFILHPGGTKVVEAYRSALNLRNGRMPHAEDVLRDYGNMSSVTVLFVLERYLRSLNGENTGRLGLISALGPGFSSESVLIRS